LKNNLTVQIEYLTKLGWPAGKQSLRPENPCFKASTPSKGFYPTKLGFRARIGQ
jgi:hypothetical protein